LARYRRGTFFQLLEDVHGAAVLRRVVFLVAADIIAERVESE